MSTYKAVYSGGELFHINKKHDRLGRFDTGDGDGDGIIDDHKNQRKEQSGRWSPITKPYQHSSAAAKTPKNSNKLPKSSIFKSSSFAEYKDSNGKVDNKAYTASGVKKLLGGIGGIAVGKFLQNSDNVIVSGVGFVTEYAGFFAVGYGGAQTLFGVANQIHNSKEAKK